jgi:hypothetical protein
MSLLSTNISEERTASIIRVKRINELETLAANYQLKPSSLIRFTQMMEEICSTETSGVK